MEFEKQAKQSIELKPVIKGDDCESYINLAKDSNYEKISINKEMLVDMASKNVSDKMQKEGYFVCRVPGTWRDEQKNLVIPADKVFKTDDGKTFTAFLPKNQLSMVADKDGNIENWTFAKAKEPFDQVTRNFKNIQEIKKIQPEITPLVQPEITPLVQPEITPLVQSKVTPLVQSEVTPLVQSKVTPLVQSEVTPLVQSEVTPLVQPVASPVVQPVASPVVGSVDKHMRNKFNNSPQKQYDPAALGKTVLNKSIKPPKL